MAGLGKIDHKRLLLLRPDIVHQTNGCCAQAFFPGCQGAERNLFGKHIQPQRLHSNSLFLAERHDLCNNGFQLCSVRLFA